MKIEKCFSFGLTLLYISNTRHNNTEQLDHFVYNTSCYERVVSIAKNSKSNNLQ